MSVAGQESVTLVVFDVDGTLTDTMGIDHLCFTQAYSELFSGASVDDDFADYEHVTDVGIFTESFRRSFDRDPGPAESVRFKARFLELFTSAVSRDAHCCPLIAGADRIFAVLKDRGFATALATGSWREAATLKLATAGVPVDRTPMACGEDGVSRKTILKTAVSRAAQVYGVPGFRSVVCVGDGLWDARAALGLGYAFIAIGCGARAQNLSEAGAYAVFEDYADGIAFGEACLLAGSRHGTAEDSLPPLSP